MESPVLLQQIVDFVTRDEPQQARARLAQLAFPVLLQWEAQSEPFRRALERLGWWEQWLAREYPATHERLKRSAGRRSNAATLWPGTTVWRSLAMALHRPPDQGIWHAGDGAQAAVGVADEFGVDRIHLVVHSEPPVIRVLGLEIGSFTLPTEALWNPSREHAMAVVQLWTIPFQNAVLVLLRSRVNGHHELVWVRSEAPGDLALWAVNHNTLLEDPRAFMAPAFLQGDPTLRLPVLFTSTEGRTDIKGAQVACAVVTVRQRDTLVFDEVKRGEETPTNWRDLLTAEVWEPYADVTASCYVLDSLLLSAGNDGILRAHPRGNPHSVYHVEDVQSQVYQMVALFNVVAMVHSVDVLEVRHVARHTEDPFVRFEPLYRATAVDSAFAPLLYGPYVVYRQYDGAWVRVAYEGPSRAKELVKVPHHAGWEVVAIKAANWRYWILTLRRPGDKGVVDVFLISVGKDVSPFLVAHCVECGAKASHLCGVCVNVGFCVEHGKESTHLDGCWRNDN